MHAHVTCTNGATELDINIFDHLPRGPVAWPSCLPEFIWRLPDLWPRATGQALISSPVPHQHVGGAHTANSSVSWSLYCISCTSQQCHHILHMCGQYIMQPTKSSPEMRNTSRQRPTLAVRSGWHLGCWKYSRSTQSREEWLTLGLLEV